MEIVADALDEIVSFIELAAGAFGDNFGIDEFLELGEATFDAGDPEDVLAVAQAAAAFLDVGFLEEDGAGVFSVTLAQVLAAQVEECLLVFIDAFFIEARGEGLVEFFITNDEACIHQGGFTLLVCACFVDAFCDRPAGVSDFEACVPEDVEDFLDGGGDGLGEFIRRLRQEKEEIEIRGGIQVAPAISSLGHKGDDGSFPFVSTDGGFEHHGEDGVQQFGAGCGDFQASGALAVALEDVCFLGLDEAHDEGGAFHAGELSTDNGFELTLGVFFEFGFGHG